MKKNYRYKRISFDDICDFEGILSKLILNARLNTNKAKLIESKQYWMGYSDAVKAVADELEAWFKEL